MTPRLIEAETCPHCKAELPEPMPRVCPECGGSLQKRYLEAGCLTSKPLFLVAAGGATWFAAALAGAL